MKVSVSILKEKNNIKESIEKIKKTDADYIHLDIMDKTFTEEESFKLSNFLPDNKYDIHIMSYNLDYQIMEAIKLNPSIITFHIEATKDVKKYINIIKENNIKVGIAINPKTRLFKIKKYLKDINQVLVMSVVPGKGGQSFISSTIKKLIKLNKYKNNFEISIDGGINDVTIKLVKDYVDTVVSGSYITDSDNYQDRINILKKSYN